MREVADLILMTVKEFEKADEIRARVEKLCKAHPLY
jgi:hypothetical protein